TSRDIAGGWTEVTAGYVASAGPRCAFSQNTTKTFIGGAGGYAYKAKNITSAVSVIPGGDGSATTEDINDVHALGQTVVFACDNNDLLVSTNGGESVSLLTGPSVGDDLLSVRVVSPSGWFIGTSGGELFVTQDGGDTYAEVSLPGASAITAITSIDFSIDEPLVGYLSASTAGSARVLRTVTGGRVWYNDVAIGATPSNVGIAKVRACGVNQVAAIGEAAGSDGLLVVAR
ncbi:MAG: hypothetical protein HC927_09375, partial [Deltaproteobacteria bacterium]|nr:hypothetical protein [Deltaproteobacteria bacterium]